MQSTWYLFPGQTIETTKISDRGKALVGNSKAWSKITDHLNKNKIAEDILNEELAKRQYLKDGSYEMTKHWDNSIEKIRQRRIEEHESRIRTQKEDRMNRFMTLRKEQEIERRVYIENVRKRMFMLKEKPRNINTALLLSEVMNERELQLQFNERQNEHIRIENEKYAQQVKFDAEQERLQNVEKRKNRKYKDVTHHGELRDQIHENLFNKQQEQEKRMNAEIIDNIKQIEEMRAIKEYEMKKDREKKNDTKQMLLDFRAMQKQVEEEQHQQDVAESKIIEVHAKAKCQIDRMRKQKEEEMFAEKIRIRNAIASKVMAERAGVQAIEDAILENARIELEKREVEKLENKEKEVKRLREERIDAYKKCMTVKSEKLKQAEEVAKFEFLNRLKTRECMESYEKDKKRKQIEHTLKYRQMLQNQIDEKKRVREQEKKIKEEEYRLFIKKITDENNNFLAYGDEVKDLAKSRGRSTKPIEDVIEIYKMENGLKLKNKNISHMTSSVPISGEKEKKTCACK